MAFIEWCEKYKCWIDDVDCGRKEFEGGCFGCTYCKSIKQVEKKYRTSK